ncbi:hypothetical protein ACOMHN_055516 [Nucella lapillus]
MIKGVSSPLLENYHISNTHIDDVAFTTHISDRLHPVRSLLDCLRQCAADRHRCKAVTFIPGRPALCQGHSKVMATGDISVALPRAKTFALGPVPPTPNLIPDWVSSRCKSSADCVGLIPDSGLYQPTQLPTCYKKLCLCSPSYFYSVNQKICVPSCPKGQFQPTFRMYPDTGMDNHNDFHYKVSERYCVTRCSTNSDCQNLETNKKNCKGGRDSSVAEFNSTKRGWNYYQRDCA